MELGEILRDLRTKRKIPMGELAEKIGATSSHISQIERNMSSPSITLLKKIAAELGVSITYFFDEEASESFVIKKEERNKFRLANSSLTYELLTPAKAKKFQMLLTRIKVGGKLGDVPIGHEGEECCYVMQGEIEMIVHDKVYQLSQGDSIYYGANAPHNVINMGDVEAIIISAISPASF